MDDQSDETRRVIEHFWAAMQANDWRAAADLFAPNYRLSWPQSGEQIVGAENFVAINAAYPAAGVWTFRVDRLLVDGASAVSDVAVSDGAVEARAITFSTVRDGRIVAQVEYWPEPFEAPEWRAEWVQLL